MSSVPFAPRFEVDDFDALVTRIRELEAELVEDVQVNPNAGHRETWIRKPDGYLVSAQGWIWGGAGVGLPRPCNGSGLAGQSLVGV